MERSLVLLDVLSAAPRGLEREEIRWRVPGYRNLVGRAAFERAFERDKQVLRALGISLLAERVSSAESGFIYRLEQRSPASSFVFSAIDFAVVSRCARAWERTELERLARSALLKLGTFAGYSIPEDSGEVPLFTADPGLLECIVSLAEGKGISFSYGVTSSHRKLFCWGLGLRFGHWYVSGWDAEREQERLFRLDRMSDVKVLAIEGPVPPAGFSMMEVLEGLSSAVTPQVLTVDMGKDYADLADRPVRISPSFGVLDSARGAVAQGATHPAVIRGIAGHTSVDDCYQWEVACAEQRLRLELLAWHSQAPELMSLPTRDVWKPLAPQRSRESVSEQLVRLLLMVNLVAENGGMYLAELADFFDVSERKVRRELEDLSASLDYESLTVEIDVAGFVTVQGKEVITSGVAFTPAESLVLGLALDLAVAAEVSGAYALVRFKLWSALSAAGLPASEKLQKRVAVYQADLDADVAYALKHRVPLNISYRSRRGLSSRTIEPVSLVIDNGPKYVRAWCRSAGEYRNFILESITESRVAAGQTYEHKLNDPGTSPRQWLRELVADEGQGQRVELFVPVGILGGEREKALALLDKYSSEVAENPEGTFYSLSVVHRSWFFSLLVELGPRVLILSPDEMRQEFIDHLEMGRVWES